MNIHAQNLGNAPPMLNSILAKYLERIPKPMEELHTNPETFVKLRGKGRFPDNHFPGQTFPGQDLSRIITFPNKTFLGNTFPGQLRALTRRLFPVQHVSRTICINNFEHFGMFMRRSDYATSQSYQRYSVCSLIETIGWLRLRSWSRYVYIFGIILQ